MTFLLNSPGIFFFHEYNPAWRLQKQMYPWIIYTLLPSQKESLMGSWCPRDSPNYSVYQSLGQRIWFGHAHFIFIRWPTQVCYSPKGLFHFITVREPIKLPSSVQVYTTQGFACSKRVIDYVPANNSWIATLQQIKSQYSYQTLFFMLQHAKKKKLSAPSSVNLRILESMETELL